MKIREATERDHAAVVEIYNDQIRSDVNTFRLDPLEGAELVKWLAPHSAPEHPILVAERQGTVAGWSSLSPWSESCGYSATCETSVYIHADHRGAGVGRQLMEALIERAREFGHHTLLARLEATNAPSRHLHEKLGFETVGVMHEVGFKFGRHLDVELMELILK